MDASREAIADANPGAAGLDLETVFRSEYDRIARLIARVIHDPSRAEELAVEVFLNWQQSSPTGVAGVEGWLYRAAVRISLDELRRQQRRHRYQRMLGLGRPAPTPEEIHASNEDQERVRRVLSAIDRRQAEILLLRGQGFSYNELASALDLNPASVGTLVSRAQQAFRKEYIKRYGATQRIQS